jgi:diphosphomevalonate decarboxylase
MTSQTATALAHPNIAFIKYWGNINDSLRLPANPSLSMNLDGLKAETTVTWDDGLPADTLTLNDAGQTGEPLARVSKHLDVLRKRLGVTSRAAVVSRNNFPTGAGIASSAAAFAALTVAAVGASGQSLSERELTTLARLGSGSASRSVPGGFVEWFAGAEHETSYAQSFGAVDHWPLVDVIAVVSDGHKRVGSTAGHKSAQTSILQSARVADAEQRFETCRRAVVERDFESFAEVVERDSNLMHAVMMTSIPPLFYWEPQSLAVMARVREWRANNVPVCYTLDAGPNVHCLCLPDAVETVRSGLLEMSGMKQVYTAGVGGPARLL